MWFLLALIFLLGVFTYQEGLCIQKLKSYPILQEGVTVTYITTPRQLRKISQRPLKKGERIIYITKKSHYEKALLKLNHDVNDSNRTRLRVEPNMKIYYIQYGTKNFPYQPLPIKINKLYEYDLKSERVNEWYPSTTINCLGVPPVKL